MRYRSRTLLLVGLLLCTVIATPVAAQRPASQTILLDQDAEQVGQVTVDGQTYTIYRYQNALSYASGLAVYTNGREVTTESEVTAVIEAFAQRQAVETFDENDVEALRAIERNATAVRNVTQPTVWALTNTTSYLDSLKHESIGGNRTAWEAATNESALEEFNTTDAPELRQKLQAWQTAGENLRTNTTALIGLLERRQNGGAVNATTLYRQYRSTMTALETFTDRTEQLNEDLSETATTTKTIAVAVYDVPEHGETIALQFVQLSHRLQVASDRASSITNPMSERQGTLTEPQETAESTKERLMADWHTRRGATTEVYGTLIGVPVAVLALGGFLYWRRH